MIQEPIYADKVHQFLSDLLPRCRQLCNPDVTQELEGAILHYVPPLTSEFFGKTMVALEAMVARCSSALSPSELEKAEDLIRAIKQQWFS
jgi:hypothetical protein